MSDKRNKVILYFDKLKKIFIAYTKPEVKSGKTPSKKLLNEDVDVVYNGINNYVDSFKEKWIIKEIEETKSTANELTITMKFKLELRKTE